MKEYKYCLKAVAIGDFCGSSFEGVYKNKISPEELNDNNMLKCQGFKRNHLTDDSVCTFGIASAIMSGDFNYEYWLKRFSNKYPNVGYGDMYYDWLIGRVPNGYGSWGNGAPMRCSPIAWYAESVDECDKLTEDSCQCTHNSSVAIEASKILNRCIFYAKRGNSKESIVEQAYVNAPHWKNLTLDNYVEYFKKQGDKINFAWYVKADNMVYMCIKAFEESTDFESALKLAIGQGFDTDTAGAIIAPLAYAYYKEIPEKYLHIINMVFTPEMELINATFCNKFIR